jgi:hypothetical protein
MSLKLQTGRGAIPGRFSHEKHIEAGKMPEL